MDQPTTDASAATTPDPRPAKVQVLAAQLDTSRDFFAARLEGLTDHEYLWEPVPGAWNLRPAHQVRTSKAAGKGEFLPTLPLVDILWWMNREYIHHAAEIAFLRDLYAWTHPR